MTRWFVCMVVAMGSATILCHAGSPDPCEDFYQYACGAWEAANPIPKSDAAWGRANEILEHNTAVLHEILESSRTIKPERTVVRREIGDYFEACMDTGTIEHRGTTGLQADMKLIEEVSSAESLRTAIVHLHQKGIYPFWVLSASPDFENSKVMLGELSQAGLSLPSRAYYERNDDRSKFLRSKLQEHIAATFTLFGDNAERSAAQAGTILKLETRMALKALERQDQIDPQKTHHKLTVDQLAELMPHFSWAEYLKAIDAPRLETLNVQSTEYFKGIDGLLADADYAAIRMYLRWRVLRSTSATLPDAFVKLNFDFYGKTLAGVKEQKPRWWRCTTNTDGQLGEALGQEFVAQAFAHGSKEKMIVLVQELLKSLDQDVHEISWMSDATRAQALQKLQKLTWKIGYPEKWLDYSKVTLRRDDYLGNVQRLNAFQIARDIAKIGTPVDAAEWEMTPPTVNASYEPSLNSINFPAGILQPPFFSVTASDAENLGAIGAVIGHELTHGFDNNGRQYDADGNLRDWWLPEDNQTFQQRAQCFIGEYETFDFAPGVKGNGQLTLGENIADNGGLRIAYRTLRRLLDATPGAAEKRDAAGLTPEQQFFKAFGVSWCQNTREETARNWALTDEHSPAKWRVNGTVQNMPEFHKAFGCTTGQPMVRAAACRVW